MKKRIFARGLCLVLAFLLLFPMGACKKKKQGVGAELKKNAKDAVFRETTRFTTEVSPQSVSLNNGKFIIFTNNGGDGGDVLQWQIGTMDGSLSPMASYKYRKSAEETETGESENIYIGSSNVVLVSDGTVVAMEEHPDYVNYTDNEYYLLHFSENGEVLSKNEIKINQGESFGYIYALSGETVAITTSNGIMQLDLDGKVLATVENNDSNNVSWNDFFLGKNGELYLTETRDGKNSIKKVDFSAKSVGPAIAVPEAKRGNKVNGSGKYDYYLFSGDSSVSGVDLTKNTVVEVFNYMDSDLDTSTYRTPYMLDDTHALCVESGDDPGYGLVLYEKVPPEQVVDKEIISLGTFYMSNEVKKIISNYNKTNGKYKIRVINYSDYNTMENEWTGGETQFKNDIATGSIPDIMLTGDVPNVDNYINKGLFVDLTPLMEKAGMNKSDYLDNVVASGSRGDKLYVMTTRFAIGGFVILSSHLNGKQGITLKEYMELEKKYDRSGAGINWATRSQIIEFAMNYNCSDFLDVATKKCNFDSDEFRDLLELASTYPEETSELEEKNKDLDYSSSARMNKLFLYQTNISSFRFAYRNEQSLFGSDTVIMGFPNLEGDSKPVLLPLNSFAISAKSKNKDAAFDFLKQMLSPEAQASEDVSIYGGDGFPVLKTAFDAMAESAKQPAKERDGNGNWVDIDPTEDVYSVNGKEYQYENIPDDRLEYFKSVITSTSKTMYNEQKIKSIVNEEVAPYFAGQKSAAEVTRIIQSRVSIYVKESQ